MSTIKVREEYRSLVQTSGRIGVHTAFPDDFELYMFALELVDSNNKQEQLFIFPVAPSNIAISKKTATSIHRGSNSVIVNSTDAFIPFSIKISGNFGRRLKLVTGNSQQLDISSINIRKNKNQSVFSATVKSGYGAAKTLEKLLEQCSELDENGQPKRLILYNSSFNQSVVVEPINWNFSQNDRSSNMLWDYDVMFQAVSRLDTVNSESEKSIGKTLTSYQFTVGLKSFAKQFRNV